jgi:hypothetical protein
VYKKVWKIVLTYPKFWKTKQCTKNLEKLFWHTQNVENQTVYKRVRKTVLTYPKFWKPNSVQKSLKNCSDIPKILKTKQCTKKFEKPFWRTQNFEKPNSIRQAHPELHVVRDTVFEIRVVGWGRMYKRQITTPQDPTTLRYQTIPRSEDYLLRQEVSCKAKIRNIREQEGIHGQYQYFSIAAITLQAHYHPWQVPRRIFRFLQSTSNPIPSNNSAATGN